jgi:thiamine pyrophosphate-dependent acetolactate synthase large subunit-like protein
MIAMRDAMRAVLQLDRGDVVLTTETAIRAWEDVLEDETLHLPVPAMSKGSSVALGVALAHPDRRVVLWDGDGGLLMNLGGLVTVAGQVPKNLYHIVLENGMYAMTGGQPTPNADNVSYPRLAEGAGYAGTFEFDDLEEWTTGIGELLEQDGPLLIVMKTEPEITDWNTAPPAKSRHMREAAPVARDALAKRA